MIVVAIVNESTVLSDVIVQAAVVCLQAQIDEDYTPVYGKQARLEFHPKGYVVPEGTWELVFADNSDQAGALGYHETTANGDPIGFVFAGSDIQFGESWTVTASHELLEMMEDPDIQTLEEQDLPDGSMVLRSKELCDVCEDDSIAYTKPTQVLPDGTLFKYSDFVFPAYWNADAPAHAKLDFCGLITKPLTILPGGYIGMVTILKGFQWTQVNAMLKPGGKRIHHLSRRDRRTRHLSTWRRSTRGGGSTK